MEGATTARAVTAIPTRATRGTTTAARAAQQQQQQQGQEQLEQKQKQQQEQNQQQEQKQKGSHLAKLQLGQSKLGEGSRQTLASKN